MTEKQTISDLNTRIAELEADLATMKQNEALLSIVFKQSVNSIAILDVAGNLVYANPKLLSVYDQDVEEVINQNWRSFIPESATLRKYEEEMVNIVLTKGETWQKEIYDPAYAEEPVWRKLTLSPIKDEKGNITHVFYTSEDITDKKVAEEALRTSEKKFRELVENIDEVFFILDPDGRFTYISPMITKILGYKPAELINKMSAKFVFKEDLPTNLREWEALKHGQLQPSEYRVVDKSGQVRWVRSYTRPHYEENKIVELWGVLSNITELKRSQEILIQTEKMISVGGLAAGMAHEINNPLAAILQSIQMIERRLAPGESRNVRAAEKYGIDLDNLHTFLEERHILSFLSGIRTSGERAAHIVDNMLKFTRKSESKLEPANLTELLEHSLELAANDYDLNNNYDFRHVEIIKQFDPALTEIPCAKTEIEQVILNLLSNAAHSLIGKTGDRPPCIILRTRRESETARIEIEDNGSGMEESIKRRIFEPFFTTKQEGTGTGLGLSVSYTIITNNHGGLIEVESEPGQGSKFIIQLPLKKADP